VDAGCGMRDAGYTSADFQPARLGWHICSQVPALWVHGICRVGTMRRLSASGPCTIPTTGDRGLTTDDRPGRTKASVALVAGMTLASVRLEGIGWRLSPTSESDGIAASEGARAQQFSSPGSASRESPSDAAVRVKAQMVLLQWRALVVEDGRTRRWRPRP
jgi:hypothetical protein